MRLLCLVLALASGLVFTGCLHRPGRGKNAPPSGSTAAPARPAPAPLPTARLVERAATLDLVYVYVDADVRAAVPEEPAVTAARNLALSEAVALTLRDQLRARGFDVRNAEAAAARDSLAESSEHEAFDRLYATARAVAAGEPIPETSRHATHLHPNAPPLLFFAALQGTLPESGAKHPASAAVLGAFVADATSGDVLWSERVTVSGPPDDTHVRQLAAELLRMIPSIAAPPPTKTASLRP